MIRPGSTRHQGRAVAMRRNIHQLPAAIAIPYAGAVAMGGPFAVFAIRFPAAAGESDAPIVAYAPRRSVARHDATPV